MLFLLTIITRTYYQRHFLPAPFFKSTVFYRHRFLTSDFLTETFFQKATFHKPGLLKPNFAPLFLVFSRYGMDALEAHAWAVIGSHGGLQGPTSLGAMEDIMIDNFL